jgi:hypothetical protein
MASASQYDSRCHSNMAQTRPNFFHIDSLTSFCYYLFKKFLVSDWLTANCEIVVSTQWLTKYGFFTSILAKWRRRVNTKKIWTRLRHITMTTRIILTRWRHWYDATTAAEGLRNCFFLNTNKIQMFVFNFLNKLKNSLIIHEENTKKNHKRVVSVYVIQIHVDLHKL